MHSLKLPLTKTEWTEAALRALVVNQLATMVKIGANEFDLTRSFDEYGLDSIDAVIATGWLGEQVGVDLPPEFLFRNTNVEMVVRALLDGGRSEAPAARQLSRSPFMAFAVSAIIGRFCQCCFCRMRRIVSYPSISGIMMSMRTASTLV